MLLSAPVFKGKNTSFVKFRVRKSPESCIFDRSLSELSEWLHPHETLAPRYDLFPDPPPQRRAAVFRAADVLKNDPAAARRNAAGLEHLYAVFPGRAARRIWLCARNDTLFK